MTHWAFRPFPYVPSRATWSQSLLSSLCCVWPPLSCLWDLRLSKDAGLGFQDMGPALPSPCLVSNARALLWTLYPLAIILSPCIVLYVHRDALKGKAIPIWNLTTFTSGVASGGPDEGIGQIHTCPGSGCMSFLSPEGFRLALQFIFRNSQQ